MVYWWKRCMAWGEFRWNGVKEWSDYV